MLQRYRGGSLHEIPQVYTIDYIGWNLQLEKYMIRIALETLLFFFFF